MKSPDVAKNVFRKLYACVFVFMEVSSVAK